MRGHPKVILYSTSLHTWEVWRASRPLKRGSLEDLTALYPEAMKPSPMQLQLAEEDQC